MQNIEQLPNVETTLQRVLRHVFGRTRGVSETQSLAGFLFKDQEAPPTENAYIKWDKSGRGGTKKLRMVDLMRTSINNFLGTKVDAEASYKDFSEAPVAIAREARQLPDANNLQKRYAYKLSYQGPNPNGLHTVMAKKNTLKLGEPGFQNYSGLSLHSSEALCKHFVEFDVFQRMIGALPNLINYFERGSLLSDANHEIFSSNEVG